MLKIIKADLLSLIPQQTSWGPLRISSRAFRLILASHHVFVPFLDFVQAYGSKRHADQHNWSGARWKVSHRQVDENSRQVHGKNFLSYASMSDCGLTC